MYFYTVENIGSGPTIGAPWRDQLLLTSEHDRGRAVLYTFTNRENMPAGGRIRNNVTVYIPQDSHGTLYLRLIVDERNQVVEENDLNNVHTSPAIMAPPLYPDVAVQDFNLLTNGRIVGGQDIEVEWSVINIGEAVVGLPRWYDAITLVSNRGRSYSLASVRIRYEGDFMLEPNMTYYEEETLTLPLELDYSTTYRMALEVNSRRSFNENQRLENNGRVLNMTILPPPSPDLNVSSVSFTYFPPGRILTTRWRVRNIGNTMTTASSWRDEVYISPEATFHPSSSVLLGHSDLNLRMQADQEYTLSESSYVSSSLSGDFYIYVVIDASDAVMEIDGEDNNVLKSNSSFTLAAAPAITLNININLGILQKSYFTGQNFRVEYNVTNVGEIIVRTSSWVDGIYLSDRQNPSRTYLLSHGFLLADILNNRQLGLYETYTAQANVTLPHTIRGRQFLTVLLDTSDTLDLRVQGAQGTFISIQLGPLPDLAVRPISRDLNITTGQPAEIQYSVTNEGEAAARSLWYEAIMLSQDPELDTDDTRLVSMPNLRYLAVNESYNQSVDVFIPNDLPIAFYYIFIMVNSRPNDLYEEETENNLASFIIYITEAVSTDISALSLRVLPTNVTYGNDISYSYTLRNIGSIQARGYKCDSIYFSQDDTWDLSDFEIGDPVCGFIRLNPYVRDEGVRTSDGITITMNDMSYSRHAVAPFIANGGYYGLVRTRTNIRDLNLDNNIAATPNRIEINAPSIELGRVTRIRLEPNDIRVFQIQGVPQSETLIANLTTGQLFVYHDLFVRYKKTPTGAEHDGFSQFALSPNQLAVARHTKKGTYYLRIESFTNSDLTASYDVNVLVRIARFEIHSISPTTAAPLGDVTIKISGTVISYFSFAFLTDSLGDVVLEASKMYWFNSESVYATFNITGLSHSEYSLRLMDEKTGNTAYLNNSFTVAPGIPGRLAISVQSPRRLRVGEEAEVTLALQNIGNTDMFTPHLSLVTRNDVHFKLVDTSGPIDFSNEIHFLGIPTEGPGGILHPGGTAHINFRVAQAVRRGIRARYTFKHKSNASAPHSFVNQKSALKPSSIPANVWDEIWENFIRSVGTTQRSLEQRLSEVASEFSLAGKRTYSITDMVAYQLQIAYGLLSGKNRPHIVT